MILRPRTWSALSCALALACQSTPAEPEPPRGNGRPPVLKNAEAPGATASAGTLASSGTQAGHPFASATSLGSSAASAHAVASSSAGAPLAPAKPVAEVKASADDPVAGKFSLTDATQGLAGKGPLQAVITTEKGDLVCDLFADKAPISVANFVGLARGKRPFKTPEGKWEKKAAYDGTTFHRIIKGFMIQGGDPKGDGSGEPGYVIPDEIWAGAKHDHRGQLCMANRGPNTNGMQFFVTDGSAPHLDGKYTIFGQCSGDAAMDALVATPVRGDRAIQAPKITKVVIRRAPAKAGK